jgi:coenzyme F420-0:L-glutamate ligase/coenzyme F420-1:gamma-L-glutamate ligase
VNGDTNREHLPSMSEAPAELRATPIVEMGEIRAGDSLAEKLLEALRRQGLQLEKRDVVIVKHKVVSKAEGRVVALRSVKPRPEALEWASQYNLDARVIELALRESKRIVRQQQGVLITETRHGLVCANSGVDVSNVDGGASAALLPEDPDGSAEEIRQIIQQQTGISVGVIISDSFGRPWREGLCEAAIGVAGFLPVRDYRGQKDTHGYTLHSSMEAVADELACVAGLVCGKLSDTPACIIRGFSYEAGRGRASDMVRASERDLFR